jgi:hypothetical protein
MPALPVSPALEGDGELPYTLTMRKANHEQKTIKSTTDGYPMRKRLRKKREIEHQRQIAEEAKWLKSICHPFPMKMAVIGCNGGKIETTPIVVESEEHARSLVKTWGWGSPVGSFLRRYLTPEEHESDISIGSIKLRPLDERCVSD